MQEPHRVSVRRGAGAGLPHPSSTAVVGASYAFDPGAEGIAGIYAARVLERGIDPRVLCAEVRADRLGLLDRAPQRRALMARSRVTRFGRGTATHLQATSFAAATRQTGTGRREVAQSTAGHATRSAHRAGGRFARRLAAAGLAVLLLTAFSISSVRAQETPSQSRYIVQAGDTLAGVAAEFGVDPDAILAASAVQNPPQLSSGEVLVIPDPSESPEAAAPNAAQREGSSPFVVAAYDVASGETLAAIAGAHGLDAWALATFKGMADIDTLSAGDRLRIPLTDSVSLPESDLAAADDAESTAPADTWTEEAWIPTAVGGTDTGWEEPAAGPVFAADVPAYQQMYSLSCEYAAASIATSAFGWGVPESAFLERIGYSANPHWGYRGDIHGAWGGADDYGVYPEALVPTLNEFGFIGDVFYGGDASALTARIDAGMPVLTWLGYFGDMAWRQEDEGSYLLAPGMHVVTVYGYDDWGVYVSNPGRGTNDYYAWGDFLGMWSILDGMALAVAPM
ncbi:MAG: LysM peptidoglycan-binding domain-containing protein [Thermomicrobiales bacterium]